MKQRFKLLLNVISIHLFLAFLFIFAMFQGDGFSWFLFFGYLPIYIYLIGVLLYPLHKWNVKRMVSQQHVFAGQSIPITIEIKRQIPFPVFYCVIEERFSDSFNQLNYGDEKYENLNQSTLLYRRMKKMIFPGFKRTFQLSYVIENIPRGKHTLNALNIKTSDVFGVIKKSVLFPLETMLFAKPLEKEIPLVYLKDTQISGSENKLHGNEQTTIVTGVRPYISGDRMTAIDWKQTARKQELMTREYETESAAKKVIMLDGSYVENMNALALEACIEIGLFVTRKKMEEGQVEFIVLSDSVSYFKCTYEQQLNELSRKLARIRAVKTNSLPVLMEEVVQRLGVINHVVLLTAHITDLSMESYFRLRNRAKGLTLLYVHAASSLDAKTHVAIGMYRQKGIDVVLLDEDKIQGRLVKGAL